MFCWWISFVETLAPSLPRIKWKSVLKSRMFKSVKITIWQPTLYRLQIEYRYIGRIWSDAVAHLNYTKRRYPLDTQNIFSQKFCAAQLLAIYVLIPPQKKGTSIFLKFSMHVPHKVAYQLVGRHFVVREFFSKFCSKDHSPSLPPDAANAQKVSSAICPSKFRCDSRFWHAILHICSSKI